METVKMMYDYFSSVVFHPSLLLVLFLGTLHYYIENSRTVKLGKKIPGPPTIPFFGNALMAVGIKPETVVMDLQQIDFYGSVIRAFLGPRLFVFLTDCRDVEVILGSHVHIDKSSDYKFFQPLLGDGLLVNTGEKWRNHRKIIAPTFHISILKSFVPLFYENSKNLVNKLRKEIGREFDCHDYLSESIVNTLLETAMGFREADNNESRFDYAMAIMKFCNIIHRRQYDLLLRIDAFFRFTSLAKQQVKFLETIHGLTSRVIRKRKAELLSKGKISAADNQRRKEEELRKIMQSAKSEEQTKNIGNIRYVRDDLDEIDEEIGEKRRLAFLEMLLELTRDGVKLSEEEVKDEVNTIMFEGHDTLAAGSSFVLTLLGAHQDIQARVYEELEEIFEGSDRPCTFHDTLEMKYLERVIMETLRLFPPVPAIARKLNEDVKLVSGDYVLPKGCTVIIIQYKVHRMKEYYPDPDKFDPDNFLPQRMQNRHYYSYIPFSAGPRSCVGRKYAMLKMKVLLSTILRNYKIHSNFTDKEFKLQGDIILKRSDGFKIKIESRVKTTTS